EQREAQGHAERAWQVECAPDLALAVRGNERERQKKGGTRERDIDEEDRLPAEHLRQHAAKQYADHEAGGAGAAPDRYRAVALWAFREGRVDERQGGREDQGTTEPLEGASDEHDLGRRSESPREGGSRVQREPRDQNSAASEQVGGSAPDQQETCGRHRVSADYHLQGLGGVADGTSDLWQGHHDDVL